ncbi:unnamed protein product, partial [Eruca vesicaria subsp. sativa]|nr:unnamed protein product [Eruca vesicaria subsp. sativa]
MKTQMNEDEEETLKEAYERGRTKPLNQGIRRSSIRFAFLRNWSSSKNEKTEFELVLAESKLQDVKVPTTDWLKLDEPM